MTQLAFFGAQDSVGRYPACLFGGLTTAIERGYMVSLLEKRSSRISGKEASRNPHLNPSGCNREEILRHSKSTMGVNAIELGIQSMKDRVLAANHRGHTAVGIPFRQPD